MRRAWRAARRPRPGLTLIELLMLIALTGVLFAVLLPPLSMPCRQGVTPWADDRAASGSEAALADRGFIGVQLDPAPTEDGFPRIRAMVAGSPAHQAGAWPGDAILRVDRFSTRNRGANGTVRLITRGRPGSRVRLTVRRPGSRDTRDLRIVRGSFYDVFLPGIAAAPHGLVLPVSAPGRLWDLATVDGPAMRSRYAGRVRLWSAATGHSVVTFSPGPDGRVESMAFSPDGRLLTTVERSGSGRRLWLVAP